MATTATTTTTAPATTTTPATTTVVSKIEHDWTWIQQHLLALVLVALLIGGAVYGVEGIIARHDAANDSKYAALLATQTAQTKTLVQQLSDFEAQATVRDQQYQATIASLAQSINTRNANAKKQAQVDANLDVSAAAARLAQQTQAAAGEVTVSNNDVLVDLPITRRIVDNLDTLPVVQADLVDTQTQLNAQKALTADAQTDTTNAKAVINSQTVQLADQTKACNAQVKAVKAKNRRTIIKAVVITAASVALLILTHGA